MGNTKNRRGSATGSIVILALGLWLVAVIVGSLWLYRYALTAATSGPVADVWPSDASFHPTMTRPVLVMFLHPHCPCSRASVEELNRLLVRRQNRLEAFAVFVQPGDVQPGWENTELWRSAEALPGVHTICDERGEDHRRFGVKTSGETLLYDVSGRLVFRGGITPSRGHEGDNASLDALAARIDDPSGGLGLSITNVFGCPLTAND